MVTLPSSAPSSAIVDAVGRAEKHQKYNTLQLLYTICSLGLSLFFLFSWGRRAFETKTSACQFKAN